MSQLSEITLLVNEFNLYSTTKEIFTQSLSGLS